jgi:sugar lactone lactonase YvrE
MNPRTGHLFSVHAVLALVITVCAFGARPAHAEGRQQQRQAESPRQAIQLVSAFPQQVTGVAVTENRRVFVNFPRWTEDVAISVAELVDGRLRAYPNQDWNQWRNARMFEVSPRDHFVCVQSVFADGRGSLWVIDPAAPNAEHVVKDGPKLVQIDLSSDEVRQTIPFDPSVAPQGSYLNDIRISPDGRFAYITDSGVQGALVVVDVTSGHARRVLDGHPSTQVEPDVKIIIDGKELRRPDGRAPLFAADSIALDHAGQYLYWKALTGRTLYRINTAALNNPNAAPSEVAGRVEKLGTLEPTDGFWMDQNDRLFLTSIQDNAVKVREPDGRVSTVVQDRRLRWPDTLGQGPDGMMYVTASHIQDSPWFHEQGWTRKGTELWRFSPTGEPVATTGSRPSRR